MNTTDRRRGFTLIEILAVLAIVLILAGMLMPALSAVLTSAKRSKAQIEISQMKAAMEEYRSKWQEYPPDYVNGAGGWGSSYSEWDSGRALVFYLGTEFRAGENPVTPWGEELSWVSTKTFGPLFPIEGDRLHEGRLLDPFGDPVDAPDSYYRFDNNVADGGVAAGTNPPDDDPDLNQNPTNFHYDGVDIWSRGPNLEDEFVSINQDPAPDGLGSDAGGTEDYFDIRSDTVSQRLQRESDDVYNQ